MNEPEVVATDDIEAVEAPAATESPPKDMETTIRETYRKLTAEKEPDESEAAPESPSTEKPRGKDGKFAKKEAEPAAPSVEAAAPTPTPVPEDPAAQYPGTWKKEIADKWTALPPEIRAEVHRREQDFHKGISEYKEAAAFGRAVGNEMLPFVNEFRQMGTTPSGVLKELMPIWKNIAFGTAEQKQQTLLQIARDAGIDIASLAAAPPQAAAPASVDPTLQQLLTRQTRLEGLLQQQTAEQARQAREAADAEIGRFRSDPANTHFAAVESQMAALISSGQADSLKDAYDKAIWLNPDTRTKLLADQAEERRKRDAEQAAAARKAASVNVVKRGTPPAPTKPRTMEDTIRETYRRLQS